MRSLRAPAARDPLVFVYGIDAARLMVVGDSKNRLLDAANPTAGVNRRVQIVNEGDGS